MKNKEDMEKKLQKKIQHSKNDESKMRYLYELASYYNSKQQFYLCKKTGEELLSLATSNMSDKYIAEAKLIIGISCIGLDSYDSAMEYLTEALKKAKEINNTDFIELILNATGIIYARTNNNEKALESYLNAIKLHDSKRLYANIAGSYYELKQYDKASEFFVKAVAVAEQNNDKFRIVIAKTGLAATLIKLGEFSKAIQLLEECAGQIEEIQDDYLITMIYAGLGKAYHHCKKQEKSQQNLQIAENICCSITGNYRVIDCCQILSDAFEDVGNLNKALHYQKRCFELSKTFFSDKLALNLAQAQESFEREKKELETSFQQKLEHSEIEMKEQLEKIHTLYAGVSGLNNIGFFSETMEKIYTLTSKLHEDRNIPVLIDGETGTGKEIVARLIHFGKDRSKRPFISVNCSAISPSLFESELFGFEGGSFTGSNPKGQKGKLELAQGGTLFLDEIGDMPLEMQPKLLRALQQKELFRIGGQRSISLDVRIICATNQDLNILVEEGKFRKDLFFRLNTAQIKVPPLRERKNEIIPFARMFLKHFSEQKKKNFQSISKETEIYLETREWTGNVRELENAIELAVMLYNDTELKPCHLLNDLSGSNNCHHTKNNLIIPLNSAGMMLEDIELEIIKQLMKQFGGNKSKTAEFLGISRMTVARKLQS